MSKLSYDEIRLERKENFPEAKSKLEGTVLVKNSRGLFLDLGKAFEGYVATAELGAKSLDEFSVGDKLEVFVCGGQNPDGIFRLSIRELEDQKSWDKLEELKGQNLELEISKIVKSGVEAKILVTGQTGFIPQRYLDTHGEALNGKPDSQWVGVNIPGRLHELDKEKNKIILNNRVISEELRAAQAEETLRKLSLGQIIKGRVIRIVDFGVFVDIGGIDALIPASELSWKRFKHPSEVTKVGEELEAKIFRVDVDEKKVGLSIKQLQDDPWTRLPEEFKIGARIKGKVVTHASFGAFVEVADGIEALLHQSNMKDDKAPDLGAEIEAEIVSIDPAKKRMGISNKIEVSEATQEPAPEQTAPEAQPETEVKAEQVAEEVEAEASPTVETKTEETKPEVEETKAEGEEAKTGETKPPEPPTEAEKELEHA